MNVSSKVVSCPKDFGMYLRAIASTNCDGLKATEALYEKRIHMRETTNIVYMQGIKYIHC